MRRRSYYGSKLHPPCTVEPAGHHVVGIPICLDIYTTLTLGVCHQFCQFYIIQHHALVLVVNAYLLTAFTRLEN